MWVDLFVNPCEKNGKECLQSIGITSLGGRVHLVRCEDHERTVAKKDLEIWLQPIKCKIPEDKSINTSHTEEMSDDVSNPNGAETTIQSIADSSSMNEGTSANRNSTYPTKAMKNKQQTVS